MVLEEPSRHRPRAGDIKPGAALSARQGSSPRLLRLVFAECFSLMPGEGNVRCSGLSSPKGSHSSPSSQKRKLYFGPQPRGTERASALCSCPRVCPGPPSCRAEASTGVVSLTKCRRPSTPSLDDQLQGVGDWG